MEPQHNLVCSFLLPNKKVVSSPPQPPNRDPPGKPQAGDEVYIGDSTLCTSDASVLLDESSALLSSLTVLGLACQQGGGLLVSSGTVLSAGRVTISGGKLLLENTGKVVATNSFVQDTFPSLIQGSGVIESPLSELRGYVSPGTIWTSCTQCRDLPWVTGSKSASSVGTIAFPGSQTNVIGAIFYLKAFSSTTDHLFFVNLAFVVEASTIFVDANDVLSEFSPFSFQTVTISVPPVVARRTDIFPWIQPCVTANCPGTGGLGSISNNCRQPRGVGPRCGSSVFDPTASSTEPCSVTSSGSALSVTVTTTSCSTSPTCSGICQHGGSCQTSGLCSCPSDSNSFTWSGTLCEVAVCPANCGGAAAGTCTVGTNFPSCVCTAPWSGLYCTTLLCSPVCLNGGVCSLAGSTSTCDCPVGFDGADCGITLAPDTCPSCGTHGACGGSATNYTCVCDSNWRGSGCQFPVCPGYVQGVIPNCGGNGICDTSSGLTPTCVCSAGWSGADCSVEVCTSTFCSNGGTCSVSSLTGTDPICTCVGDWIGATCSVRQSSATTASWIIPVAVVVPVVVVGVAIALGIVWWRSRTNATLKKATRAEEMGRMVDEARI